MCIFRNKHPLIHNSTQSKEGYSCSLNNIYGVWNLDFFHLVFEPVCLHPGMTTLGVIAIDYCVAIYPIILIALTYFLVKIHDQFILIQKLWKPLTHLLHYCNKSLGKYQTSLLKPLGHFSCCHTSKLSIHHLLF